MKKVIIATVCLSAVLCASCNRKHKNTARPALQVTTAVAKIDTLPVIMTFTGEIQSIRSVVIEPKISGTLLSKHYKSGDMVRRGQLLYRIDPSLISTQKASAYASLQSARASLVEARNNYNRAVPLAAIDAISKTSLDAYTAQYSSAEAAVRSAEAEYRNASLNLDYTTIYAPISGIISKATADVGDYVGVGTQYATLSTIDDNDTVTVALNFPSDEYYRARERFGIGTPTYSNKELISNIKLTLSDGSVYPYKGSYDYTSVEVGEMMGTIAVVVQFPNPGQTLKAGEYAKVSVDIGKPVPQIVIPQTAVQQTQNVNSVFVMRPDSTVEYRSVTLGDTFGTMWIVESGLNSGEVVLTTGQQRLRTGEKVVPKKG